MNLFKCHEAAGIITGLALGAFFFVQDGQLTFFPDDRVNRACFLACTAFDALIFDYLP
jgi:hypothetical protein